MALIPHLFISIEYLLYYCFLVDGTTEILIGVSVAIVIIAVICGIYIHRRGGNSGGRHKIPLKGRSIQVIVLVGDHCPSSHCINTVITY